MCSGGGQKGAVITMPDTGAYQQQFNMQRDLIQQQINNNTTLMQQQLKSSLQRKEDLLREMAAAKTERAENLEKIDEQVRRMNTLIGAPPPEKTAEAPRIASSRKPQSSVKRGKSGLRIARSSSSSRNGQGSGLNIT